MHLSYLRQIHELIQAYHLDRFPETQPLLAMLRFGRLSEAQARGWLYALQPLAIRQMEFPNFLLPPPDAEQLLRAGPFDFEFMTLSEADETRSGLHLLKVPQHTLVSGSTGYGKTVTIKTILIRLCEAAARSGRCVCILVFDRKGGDYKDLCRLFPDLFLHLSVHDGLRLGLDAPEGVPVRVWSSILSTIIAARCNLKFSAVTLARMIEWLVAILNPEPTDRPLWPDLQLILDVARASPATLFAEKGDYDRSLTQQLEGLVRASGELLRTFRGIDVERDLGKKSVVFEMSNLEPPNLSYIFVDITIERILTGCKHRQQKTSGGIQWLLVIDEAEVDIARASELAYPHGLFPLSKWLGQAKEFGGSTLIGAKVLGHASPLILSSIDNFIFLRQQDDASVVAATRTLMLPRGAEGMLPKLERGQAIVRMGGGWKDPYLAQIDFSPPCHDPKTTPYDTHPFVPARRLHELPEVQRALKSLIAQHNATRARQAKAANKDRLSELELKLLALAYEHPFTPVARLWDLAGRPSPAKQLEVRTILEIHNYAAFEETRPGKKNMLLIEVAELGCQILNRSIQRYPGGGGIAHRFAAHSIARVKEKRGHRVQIEMTVPGTSHTTDVGSIENGALHVFEIVVTATDNLSSHIDACLHQSNAVETVTIVTFQLAQIAALRKTLDSDPAISHFLDRVRFETITPYLKELWP